MVNSLIYLAISFLIIGGITSYWNMKRNQKFKMPEAKSYKVNKTKGYDYNNPTRFFCEPLMRYVWTPMASTLGSLFVFAIVLTIFHNDGGKWFMSQVGTDLANYLIGVPFFTGLAFLIAYTILYPIRGWGNHEKWKMQYGNEVKSQ